MRKYNRILVGVLIGFLCFVIASNGIAFRQQATKRDRQYQLSVHRIQTDIDNYEKQYNKRVNSLQELSEFSQLTYAQIGELTSKSREGVSKKEMNEFYASSGVNCAWYATEENLYRISIEPDRKDIWRFFLMMNLVLIGSGIAVFGMLIYIRNRIMKPFDELREVPYELSKGNLTIPLKENKNRFFGRFVWGLDLLREHLEEERKKEFELQREKKLLLLSLSHDIKTPLSAIKLYGQALCRNLYKTEEKRLEVANAIVDKATEIESYIGEIVKASSEDFLHFTVENEEFYVREVFDEVEEYYKEKMRLNLIDFEMEKGANCLVNGDRDRLVEILQNIIENAMKYGDGRTIWVNGYKMEEAYCISIRNTGCELDEKELPHVFDSFYRGSNVTKQEGSGLGLYICRSLIHLMEGEIMADIQEEAKERIMQVNILLRKA